MKRQIVLDTETTGISWEDGHKLIEIGCIEMIDRYVTTNRFHSYLNPQRAIDIEAQKIHGISADFLHDKPIFVDIAPEFLEFIRGAELLIHNAAFDVGFINAELNALSGQYPPLAAVCEVIDTLAIAKRKHPGVRNSLDALCKRYGIDNSRRTLHGALLDAEILADVYLAMTGGQTALGLEASLTPAQQQRIAAPRLPKAGQLPVIFCDDAELAAHAAQLESLEQSSKGQCLWTQLNAAALDSGDAPAT